MDRPAGAGALAQEAKRDWEWSAWPSGIATPRAPVRLYRDLTPCRQSAGDVLARFTVKAEEIHESLNLVDQMPLHLPGGLLAKMGGPPAGRSGLGCRVAARTARTDPGRRGRNDRRVADAVGVARELAGGRDRSARQHRLTSW
jgi:hypothetical protein